MQYSLRGLLLFALVAAASMAAGGLPCVMVVVLYLALWCCIRKPKTPVELLFWLVSLGVILALLVPDSSESWAAIDAEVCSTRLERLADAFEAYYEDHCHFPPATVNDSDGKPMHSWRALLLPYVGQEQIHDWYDFSQPWDATKNRSLAPYIPSHYTCRSPALSKFTSTYYFAVVGPNTAWSGTNVITKEDIQDGAANTILIVEIKRDTGIHWMQPADLSIDDVMDLDSPISRTAGFHRHHRLQGGGRHVLMADGTVRFLPNTVWRSKTTMKSLLTINGGEEIDVNRLGMPRPYRRWKTVSAYVVLVFSIVVVLFATRGKTVEPPAPEKP